MTNYPNKTEIQSLISQGAIFFVSHSGGKDSQAMMAQITQIVPADQIRVIHSDLGDMEHAGTMSHILENIDGRELLLAAPIHADGSRKDFFSAIRARRVSLDTKTKKYPNARRNSPAFPSTAARFCTSDLKTDPIWKVAKKEAKKAGSTIIVNCVGIRGQESAARQTKIDDRGTLNIAKKATGKGTAWTCFDWWPLAHWSIDEVWAQIEAAGQTPHPAYAAGNDRLSCVFCIFASDGDLQNGANARPDLARRLIELEKEVRTTMFNGKSLADRIIIPIEAAK